MSDIYGTDLSSNKRTGAADAHGEDGLPEEGQAGRAAHRAEALQRQ